MTVVIDGQCLGIVDGGHGGVIVIVDWVEWNCLVDLEYIDECCGE